MFSVTKDQGIEVSLHMTETATNNQTVGFDTAPELFLTCYYFIWHSETFMNFGEGFLLDTVMMVEAEITISKTYLENFFYLDIKL